MKKVDLRVINRYIQGLIKYKVRQRNLIFGGKSLGNDITTLILMAYRELLSEKSVLSPELIADKCKSISGDEWWDTNSAAVEATIYTSNDDANDVEENEVSELYTIIQRNAIHSRARKELLSLADGIEDEDSLDGAIDVMRRLKAVYPTAMSNLNEQIGQAVVEALDGARGVIPYGIQTLDRHLAGICRGEITILAGRPGHGKTSFLCQLVLNWLDQGMKVLFISKEMASFRIHHKLFANLGGISSDSLKRGEIEDKEQLHELAQQLSTQFSDKLFLYDDVYSSNRIETLIVKHRPDIVVDDFIQLSEMDTAAQRTEIMKIMKHYKAMSKENDCAFFVTSQLNRSIEGREDPIPRLSDLAESGALEQLAADVLFIYFGYKMTYNPADRRKVSIVAAKTRYGDSCTVELGFDGDKMRYFPMPKITQEGA